MVLSPSECCCRTGSCFYLLRVFKQILLAVHVQVAVTLHVDHVSGSFYA